MGTFPLFSAEHLNNSYIFLDFETTGFYPLETDRIIEIAMIKVVNGAIVDKVETFINPQRKIPESASSVNRIFDDDVKGAPLFDQKTASRIIKLIDHSILIAHNSSFDLGFLSMEMARNGITFASWRSIDTLKISQALFQGAKNKLKNLIERYHIKQTGDLHRAMVDTQALVDVFFNLIAEEELTKMSIDTIIQKYGFQSDAVELNKMIPKIIREAINTNTVLSCQYTKRDNSTISLRFLPIAPVWNDNYWYLYAQNQDDNAPVTLCCQKMNSIEQF